VARFIARRVVQLILVLLSVTFVAFGALNFLGDPLVNIVGPLAAIDYCDEVEAGLREDSYTSINNSRGDCEIIGEAKADFGLDKPVVQRYFTWLGNIITGDLGTSFQTQLPVSEIIAQKLPKSLMLMVMAQIIALAVAIPVGVYSAYRAGRAVDRATSVASFGLLSIPNFAFGVIVLQFFALRNQWLPASFDDTSIGTRIHSLILPATVLGLGIAATYQRVPGKGHDRPSHHDPPCAATLAVLTHHGVRREHRCADRRLARDRRHLLDSGHRFGDRHRRGP
jgi:peptide/nickel transport system permease protein